MDDLGMDPLAVVSLVLAAGWLVAAAARGRTGAHRQAGWCLFVAAGHLLGAAVAPAAPLILLTWLAYGLTFPDGELGSPTTMILTGGGCFGLAAWSAVLIDRQTGPRTTIFVIVALVVTLVVGTGIGLRCRSASAAARASIQWLVGAAVLAAAADVVLLALHVMAGAPEGLRSWLVAPLLLIPLGQVAAALIDRPRVAESALIESIVVSGLACLVVAVYLVVVVGLGHAPEGAERSILVSSLIAAVVVAALAQPVRHRLVELASALVDRQGASAEEVVTTFGARMSRAVPMDELMLQLTESLRATIATAGAEIWVGADGVLNRSVSVPARPPARLTLGDRERIVVGRARIGGLSWASVWLPGLVAPPADSIGDSRTDLRPDLRVAPVAHLGELLGLIVIRRLPGSAPLTDDDDRQLVELARQLGLALHNVRLDSALQASLEELEQRNQQLQASRLRIVTAADESRQAIERNLHDGAQQHLVALAVKLGLAEAIAEEDPELVASLLQELRSDVQTTIRELRELAHGIYPPLLRDRGLGEALRAAANRSPLDTSVEVDLPGRFPQEVETATYFCCLEAMQNAGKHAGADARLVVRVRLAPAPASPSERQQLCFEVTDDGAGFDPSGPSGHGFVNMNDRLGAIGGQLTVTTTIGGGTTIGGSIPVEAEPSARAVPSDPAAVLASHVAPEPPDPPDPPDPPGTAGSQGSLDPRGASAAPGGSQPSVAPVPPDPAPRTAAPAEPGRLPS